MPNFAQIVTSRLRQWRWNCVPQEIIAYFTKHLYNILNIEQQMNNIVMKINLIIAYLVQKSYICQVLLAEKKGKM